MIFKKKSKSNYNEGIKTHNSPTGTLDVYTNPSSILNNQSIGDNSENTKEKDLHEKLKKDNSFNSTKSFSFNNTPSKQNNSDDISGIRDEENISGYRDVSITAELNTFSQDKKPLNESLNKTNLDSLNNSRSREYQDHLIGKHITREKMLQADISINPSIDEYDKKRLKEFIVNSIDDLKEVNNWIKTNNVAIIDLRETNSNEIGRIVDITTGMLLAYDGSQKKLIKRVFMLTGSKVNIEPYYQKIKAKIDRVMK
ncbi:MAG: cell division protein SepF [Mycoplasmataceae bacterium]|nr:cell division protein SepF [Mycoplasmataceae bacterium]